MWVKEIREDGKKTISSLWDKEKDIFHDIRGFINSCLQDLVPTTSCLLLLIQQEISAGEHPYLARRWSTLVFIFYWVICLEMKRQEKFFSPCDSCFPFSPKGVKGIKNSAKCRKDDWVWGEEKEENVTWLFRPFQWQAKSLIDSVKLEDLETI